MNISRVEQLLNETSRIVAHQKEKEILKGEKFNVFTILRMESKENATHSAFLCELLNPIGTHLKGNVFLELFLQTIGNKGVDLSSVKVKTEHYIGPRNDVDKTGGRIDIYIWDKFGNCISIENKIYAGDQPFQVQRYVNHNKARNKVFYLTRYGTEPSPASKGDLKSESDFFIISYKKHIAEWLQLCMKEAVDIPILRETIKQYLLLIKKITFTMSHSEEKELFDIILRHHEESSIIAANFTSAVGNLLEKIRQTVFLQLIERLNNSYNNRYNVMLGNGIDKQYSNIWIKINGKEEEKIFFGIQSFAVRPDDFISDLYIGIFVFEGRYLPEYAVLGEKNSPWWTNIHQFSNFKDYNVKLSDSRTLQKLNSDIDFQIGFIEHIVNESIEYLNNNYEKVLPFLK
ncbi:MAG: PD-(D/E)XK nuclease family protein [Bacteroidota bacterium]